VFIVMGSGWLRLDLGLGGRIPKKSAGIKASATVKD